MIASSTMRWRKFFRIASRTRASCLWASFKPRRLRSHGISPCMRITPLRVGPGLELPRPERASGARPQALSRLLLPGEQGGDVLKQLIGAVAAVAFPGDEGVDDLVDPLERVFVGVSRGDRQFDGISPLLKELAFESFPQLVVGGV